MSSDVSESIQPDVWGKQIRAVYRLMSDGQTRTIDGIATVLDIPAQSVSARLRDLRKAEYGGFEVHRTRTSTFHLFNYRLGKPHSNPPKETLKQDAITTPEFRLKVKSRIVFRAQPNVKPSTRSRKRATRSASCTTGKTDAIANAMRQGFLKGLSSAKKSGGLSQPSSRERR